MLALAAQGVPEGAWLRAGTQTGGRGRMGRNWESPPGNLYCSTLVRIDPVDPPAATLALVAAIAVHAVVAHMMQAQVRIKWPNDIMADGAKLAGILLERSGDAVVVGIGVNVTGFPKGLDRPVTSLWAHGATQYDAAVLLERLTQIFAHWLAIWRAQGVEPIRNHWVVNAHPAGTAMQVVLPDGATIEGRFADMDRHGALILRLANGDTHAIHAGDVFLI